MFAKLRRWFKAWILTDQIGNPGLAYQYYSLTYITLSGMPFSFIMYPGCPSIPERRIKSMPKETFRFPVEDKDFVKPSFTSKTASWCAEVARKPEGVALRNSNDPTKNTVFFTPGEWDVFVKGVKNDEFNLV